MRASEFITESLSRVAYHYTNLTAALKILTSGEFQLSSALGSVEEKYVPKGYPYFLSTTRTKLGGYHTRISDGAAMFVLDGNWYNQRYRATSVDYWGDRDNTQSDRAHEAEDRLFSRDPSIPITGVTAVHILCKFGRKLQDQASDSTRAWARQTIIAAKKQGIPVYFYTDPAAWRQLDTRNTGDIRVLSGQAPTRGSPSRHRGYLLPWMELIQAKNKSQLSKHADQIRYNLQYTYDKQSAISGLGNDLSNARKPNSGPDRENAVRIIKFMQQNKLATVADLVDALAEKWKNIQ